MCINLCGMLIHRSRVNSSLCLEKSGYSQTVVKLGGVFVYKWWNMCQIFEDKMAICFQENCSMRIV